MPIKNKIENKLLKIAPKTVDFNVIGKCNLDCVWCWGPDHKTKHTLSSLDWVNIAKQLKKLGTENIVITGGEPLLRKDLLEIITDLKKIGMRITLSTNSILLLKEENMDVLKYIDEIGIPIDGSTEEINHVMRKGNKEAFNLAIEATKFIQHKYPNIKITIRTVLSKKNMNDIQNIPKTLLEKNIDITKFRWKIYQITPTGPRSAQATLAENDWLINEEETVNIVNFLNQTHPMMTIGSLLSKEHNARYLHIDPTGEMTTLTGKENPQHLKIGNVLNKNGKIAIKAHLKKLNESENKITDLNHGTDNFRL